MKKIIIVLSTFVLSFNAYSNETIPNQENRCYGIIETHNEYSGEKFDCKDAQNNKRVKIDHISKMKGYHCYSLKETEDNKTYNIEEISCPITFGAIDKKDAFLKTLEKRLTNINCKDSGEWSDGCPVVDEFGNSIPLIAFP